MKGSYPARSAVEVARLPKDALVEIEVTALPAVRQTKKKKKTAKKKGAVR